MSENDRKSLASAGSEHRIFWLYPPTSDGQNYFVRSPFLLFLDSMQSPLSHESTHIYIDTIFILYYFLKRLKTVAAAFVAASAGSS